MLYDLQCKILLHQFCRNPGMFLRQATRIVYTLKSQLIGSHFRLGMLRKLETLRAKNATMTPTNPPYSNLQLVERVEE